MISRNVEIRVNEYMDGVRKEVSEQLLYQQYEQDNMVKSIQVMNHQKLLDD